MTSDKIWDKFAAAHRAKNELSTVKLYTVWLREVRVFQATGDEIQRMNWDANIIVELSFSEVGFGIKQHLGEGS